MKFVAVMGDNEYVGTYVGVWLAVGWLGQTPNRSNSVGLSLIVQIASHGTPQGKITSGVLLHIGFQRLGTHMASHFACRILLQLRSSLMWAS